MNDIKFESFESVKEFISKKEEKDFVQLWIASSRTIAAARKKGIQRPIKENLKYYEVIFRCVHGGYHRKSKSTGQCPTRNSYKTNCPFVLRLKASNDGNTLDVKRFVDKHNHGNSEVMMDVKDVGISSSSTQKDPEKITLEIEPDSLLLLNSEGQIDKTIVQLSSCHDPNKQEEQMPSLMLVNVKSEHQAADNHEEKESPLVFGYKEENMANTVYVKQERFSSEEEYSTLENLKTDANFGQIFKVEESDVDDTNCSDFQDMRHTSSFEYDISSNSCQKMEEMISAVGDRKLLVLSGFQSEHNKNCEISSKMTWKNISKNKKYGCDDCNKEFPRYRNIKNHINTVHLGIRDYKCEQCHKTFLHISNLKWHTDSVHENVKKYECEICNDRFSRLNLLKKHISVIHKGIKTYECGECCKRYYEFCVLKRHIYTGHLNIRNYTCMQCNKSYYRSSHLKSHINTVHRNIRNFKCDICSKKFPLSCRLTQHIDAVHRGLKIMCNHCGKYFSAFTNLKRHINAVHNKNKNFKCDVCHNSFSHLHVLNRHIDSVHKKIKNYKCEICDKKFSRLSHVKQHSVVHKNV